MEWVARKRGAFIALALTFFISISIATAEFLGESSLVYKEEVLPLTCFETTTATLRVSEDSLCPADLISLGNGPLQQIFNEGSDTTSIHPLLQARFDAASVAAHSEGVHLYIASGFRSKARQAELFAREVRIRGSETEAAKWVLPADYSHHPLGLAIDVNYPGDRPGAAWLEANGSRFGLCRVYANEWWHFEGAIAPGGVCPPMAANALVDLP